MHASIRAARVPEASEKRDSLPVAITRRIASSNCLSGTDAAMAVIGCPIPALAPKWSRAVRLEPSNRPAPLARTTMSLTA